MSEMETIGKAATEIVAGLEPTAKQLRYLSYLANKHGSSYAVPVTRQQASSEIEQLLREPRARRARRRKRKSGKD